MLIAVLPSIGQDTIMFSGAPERIAERREKVLPRSGEAGRGRPVHTGR
ncbi:hypothetical protein SVEN_1971 [Streptomyces venezuelae ATCC 10712]|uniref:Uncharacterized protein n=1 Tax=Streptomyces venezuelae (strain ATCC 10712 / CBS 650.69 / DSM 40230 / JCM 4526 / NBRC 13096 / PD 04745) TaxID=953739 RepID=F2RJP8_STRVP|nr:hypothetical protein SVEN_1971 [Streptomyces venezuelae ATCC 10712]